MERIIERLRPWDVVYPHDALIYPPKFKMWVCVSRERLWFLRINSEPINAPVVCLPRADHSFLDHDSWLGCGGDLVMITAIELQEGLERQARLEKRGIVGRVHADVGLRQEILHGIANSARLSPFQVEIIDKELRAFLHE